MQSNKVNKTDSIYRICENIATVLDALKLSNWDTLSHKKLAKWWIKRERVQISKDTNESKNV